MGPDWRRTIVDDAAHVNSAQAAKNALKGLEKAGSIMEMSF
jgi:hypothetical protein